MPALRVAAPATLTPQWLVLALFGTGAADVEDQTDDTDDQVDACPPPVCAASFRGSADAALVLVQAKVDAENAATARP